MRLNVLSIAVVVVVCFAASPRSFAGSEVDAKMERFGALLQADKEQEAMAMLRDDEFARAVDSDGDTAFMLVAAMGGDALFDEALKHHPDIEHADHGGCTALWFAASKAKPARLLRLLALGASPDTRDKSGVTALSTTIMAGQLENEKVLLENHVSIEAPNGSGMTPLAMAVAGRYYGSARLLLQHGAKTTTPFGIKPLLKLAESNGDAQMIALLKEYGAP